VRSGKSGPQKDAGIEPATGKQPKPRKPVSDIIVDFQRKGKREGEKRRAALRAARGNGFYSASCTNSKIFSNSGPHAFKLA